MKTLALCVTLLAINNLAVAEKFDASLIRGAQGERQLISVPAPAAPTIDGRLNDDCWENAAAVTGFLRMETTDLASEKTAVFVTHDDKALYLAAAVSDSRIAAKQRPRDKGTWEDDCIEFFIDSKRQRTNRYQFIVTAAGMFLDSRLGDAKWNGKEIRFASQQYDGGWTLELAIPYQAIETESPRRGDVWDVKFSREDYDTLGGVPALSSWQFTGQNFSDPGSFGTLVFTSPNRFSNGGFDDGLQIGNWCGKGWRVSPQARSGTLELITDQGHDSPPCAKVKFEKSTQVQVCTRVQPYRHYRVTAWVNRDDLPVRAKLSMYNSKANKVFAGKHAKGWQKLETYATTGDTQYLVMTFTAHGGNNSSFLLDDFAVEEIDNTPRGVDAVCYTGNATGVQSRHNKQVAGRYRYLDFAINAWWAPERSARGGFSDVSDTPGWIAFDKGYLTDNKPTYAAWAGYAKHPGKTLEFDLGEDRYITDLQIEPVTRGLRDVRVYLKTDSDRAYTLAHWQRGETKGPATAKNLNAHARYVRIDHRGKCGLREVRIWGEPVKQTSPIKPFILPVKPGITPHGGAALADVDLCIYPTPKHLKVSASRLVIGKGATIGIPADADDEFRFIADDLAKQLSRRTGVDVKIVNDATATIRLNHQPVKDGKEHKGAEGYTLHIDAEAATITGGGLNGVFYGGQTLLQCLAREGEQTALRGVDVRDWPTLALRITQFWDKHLRENPAGIRALSRIRWNTIQYASSSSHFGPQLAQKLVKHRLEAMPVCAPMPGGGWYGKTPGMIELNPGEKLSDLTRLSRVMPCPSHPKVNELLAEQIAYAAKFPGKYAWLNIDECYQEHSGARWNVCNFCTARKLDGGELFYQHVMKLYNGLRKVGKTPAAMGLMLYHVKYKNIDQGFARLPKDMPLAAWQVTGHTTTQGHGFKTIEYPISFNWVSRPPDRPTAGIFYSADWFNFSPTALVVWGERAWTGTDLHGDLTSPRMRRQIDQGLSHMRSAMIDAPAPSRVAGASQMTPIDLTIAANCSLADTKAGDGKGLFDVGPGMDLSFMVGSAQLGGVPYQIGGNNGRDIVVLENRGSIDERFDTDIRIPVDREAASLVFLHGMTEPLARNYNTKISYVGNYLIEYEDGTRAHYPIKFDHNIRMMFVNPFTDDGPPQSLSARLMYRGVAPSGDNIQLLSAEWVNPLPDKKVKAVIMRTPARLMNSRVALFAMTAVAPSQADHAFWAKRDTESLPAPTDTLLPSTLKPIDLAGGSFVSSTRYEAPDGTVITADRCDYLDDKSLVFRLHHGVGWVTQPDNRGWQFKGTDPQTMTITFAEPRELGAVGFTGLPAVADNFVATKVAPLDVTVEVTTDGKTWQQVAVRSGYLSERDLESQHAFEPVLAKAVRLTVKLTTKDTTVTYKGLSHVRLFALSDE